MRTGNKAEKRKYRREQEETATESREKLQRKAHVEEQGE